MTQTVTAPMQKVIPLRFIETGKLGNIIMMSVPNLLPIREAAKHYHRDRRTIYRWVISGKLTAIVFNKVMYIPVTTPSAKADSFVPDRKD